MEQAYTADARVRRPFKCRERKFAMRVPVPPSGPVEHSPEELSLLGAQLKRRAENVLALTVSRTSGPDHEVDAVVQDSFERISRSSTIAVARWMAGEGL